MVVRIATFLYARVSTADQNAEIQLEDAIKSGFNIDEVITDEGVSGISTKLSERPQGKRLSDKLRAGDILVVRWVDRLGRDYNDVTETVRNFINAGVVIKTIINRMVFDGSTSDPIQMAVRDALIGFMAATAQAQAEAAKHAQKAGISKAKQDEAKYRGRKPSYDRKTFEIITSMIDLGWGDSSIARKVGVTRQSVIRIKKDRAGAEAGLIRWGM
jgi:DNA invertase Pin-like site-specific DNA recombinase